MRDDHPGDPWGGGWDDDFDDGFDDDADGRREWPVGVRIVAWVAIAAMLLAALSGVVTLLLR